MYMAVNQFFNEIDVADYTAKTMCPVYLMTSIFQYDDMALALSFKEKNNNNEPRV